MLDITTLPFVAKVGITRTASGVLTLPFEPSNHNHIETLHAGAQFALAESASGELLLSLFPDMHDKVVPVLRDSKIKYKKPATNTLSAFPTVCDEMALKFLDQLQRKGRALIVVAVELRDSEGTLTCSGEFDWYVQRLA